VADLVGREVWTVWRSPGEVERDMSLEDLLSELYDYRVRLSMTDMWITGVCGALYRSLWWWMCGNELARSRGLGKNMRLRSNVSGINGECDRERPGGCLLLTYRYLACL
jgi:hypothetical protein